MADPKADHNLRGRFVWHDLVTGEADAAFDFYEKAFGWKRQLWEQDPAHAMFAAPSGALGGTMAASEGDAPHWIPYIGSSDIEATRRQALDLNASVVKDLTDTGGGGRYMVLSDPQGAHFGLYGSEADPGRDIPPKVGQLHWHELATSDTRAAADFYTALFGWEKSGEFDMGPHGVYYLFGRNGRQLGGIYTKFAEQPGGPAWLGYTRVKDVHKTTKKVQSAGGRLVNGPMEVPSGDWVAMFVDPLGAPFAAVVLKDDMKPTVTQAAAPSASPPAAVPEEAPRAAKATAKARAKPRKPVAKAPVRKAAAKKSAAKSAKRPARKAAKKSSGRKQSVGKRKAGKVRVTARRSAAKKSAAKARRKVAPKTRTRKK